MTDVSGQCKRVHERGRGHRRAAIPIHPPPLHPSPDSVDLLYYFLTVITLFFTFAIFATIFYFMIRFRRRSPDELPATPIRIWRWN